MIDFIFPENQQSAYARTKTQISCAVTAQLISAFVFVAQTVQSFFFFNPSLYLVAIFCGCTALFVSNLVGTQIVGFLIEPRREKIGLRGFRQGLTQTDLYSHRSGLEA